MSLNTQKIRLDTPACEDILHFNNAGASLMPMPVYQELTAYLAHEQTSGGYETATNFSNKIESFYTIFSALLNAKPHEIAYVENATRAWNMAVYALPFQPDDRVIVHASEYSSNYLALLHLKKTKGIKIDIVPSDALGQIDCNALSDLITKRTKAIFTTHVPSHSGLVNPVVDIGHIAHAHDLIYVLDACQSVGQMPINVQQIGCDILCGTGRKFLRGPRGTGFLYVSDRILHDLHPPFIDLHAAQWSAAHSYQLRDDARRFENWERYVAGQVGLAAAAKYALNIGLNPIQEYIFELANTLRKNLQSIPNVSVHDQGKQKSGIVTFTKKGVDAPGLVEQLRRQKINTSAAKMEHARLDLEERNLNSVLRASLHYYNTIKEIDRFCNIIESI